MKETETKNDIRGPLEGIRVIAVENYIAGPVGSMWLADYGAEVIKVEPPWGDVYRSAEPIDIDDEGRNMSYSFLRVNRNKHSVVLDLKQPADRESFLNLVDTADVVWENLRAGVFEKLGLGWDVLRERNPRLIYASITGFGSGDFMPSPFQNRPAFDIVAQALSGVMSRVGEPGMPPMFLGIPIADELGGILAGYGVLLALQARHLTGEGQRVDISLYDSMIAINEQSIGHYSRFKELPPRGKSGTAGPYGAFRCRDGWFVTGAASNDIWQRFCQVLDAPELASDARLENGVDRAALQESILRPYIEKWASDLSAEEVTSRLNEGGVPAAPVQNVADLFDCPHVEARKMIVAVDDPVSGTLYLAGDPVKLQSFPEPTYRAAPQLGADQERYGPDMKGNQGTHDD